MKRILCSIIMLAVAAAAQAAVISEDFIGAAQNPFDGTADSGVVWVGDLTNSALSGAGELDISVATVGEVTTLVTDTAEISNKGGSWVYSVNGAANGWRSVGELSILMGSDSSSVTNIEAGTMNGLRFLMDGGSSKNTVVYKLQQADGTSWTNLWESNTLSIDRTQGVLTIDLSDAGLFTWDWDSIEADDSQSGSHNIGSAVTLGQYTGFSYAQSRTASHSDNYIRSFNATLSATGPTDAVANDDIYVLPFGESTTNGASSVLSNDIRSDSALLATNVAGGSLTFNSDGTFDYTAAVEGTNTFWYMAVNSTSTSTPAMVELIVDLTDDIPVANDDDYELDIGYGASNRVGNVLDNDTYGGDYTMFAVLDDDSTLTGGTLDSLSSDGSFSYTANPGFEGIDTFTYQAYSVGGTSSAATVFINVTNIPPAVVLYYPFDIDLTDASGNENDGSYGGSGAVITNISKFGGGSLSSAGSGYVNISNLISFTTDQNWSMSLWYNNSDPGGTNAYGLIGDPDGNNYSFVYNRTEAFRPDRNYYLRGSQNTYNSIWATTNTPSVLDTGEWHHIVITCTGAGNDLRFYEDGTEQGSWPGGDGTTMEFARIAHCAVGGIFDGFIDEVRIANYAFSQEEITSLYENNEFPGGPVYINDPAIILGFETDAFDTMKLTVNLNIKANPAAYYPMSATDLVTSNWTGVAHSDAADGTFAVGNLSVAGGDATNKVIYVQSGSPVEFFRIDLIE